MTERFNKYKFLFGAGGTGGHLFPAIAVAEKIKELKPESEILFLGNANKIEGKAVEKNGFDFKPITISGIHRGEILRNLAFPLKLLVGMTQSLATSMKFKPRVVIGSGAYVSAPVVWAGSVMGAKVILLEQNSYPGITNRLLDKKADVIFTAFEESEKYFRFPEKVKTVGNPVRVNLKLTGKAEAKEKLGIEKNKKAVLIIGGSLGARSINEAVKNNIEKFNKAGFTLLWQTGKSYYDEYKSLESENVKPIDFIDDVALYFSAADLVLARAGASTIAELAQLGLPAVLVPSPNVAANHQYKNAKELADKGAAILLKDDEISDKIYETVSGLIENEEELAKLKTNIKKFAGENAAEKIAKQAIELAEKF